LILQRGPGQDNRRKRGPPLEGVWVVVGCIYVCVREADRLASGGSRPRQRFHRSDFEKRKKGEGGHSFCTQQAQNLRLARVRQLLGKQVG
jgi:hypothetical protein